MNSIRFALENSLACFGVISPFKLTSDGPKNVQTSNRREIITNKFKDAINSIEKKRVIAEVRMPRECNFIILDSAIDAHNNEGIIEDALWGIFMTPGALCLGYLSYASIHSLLNQGFSCQEGANALLFTATASLNLLIGVGSLCSLTFKISAAMKDRISKINSDYSDLNKITIPENKLKKGQRDFNSLLVSTQDKLCPDMIGVIGQEIFNDSQKNNR